MRRPSKARSHKPSGESQRLIQLAQATLAAGSRIEERLWERQLDAALNKQMVTGHQQNIDSALDLLFQQDPAAYEALMDAAESTAESSSLQHEGKQFEALLVAVPVLAWTRYSISSGPIPGELQNTLAAHLYAHLLAADTRLAVSPVLYAIDQLPRSHAETHTLLQKLAHAALDGKPVRAPSSLPETAPFLADTRYLLAAVVTSPGGPFFRWQAAEAGTDILDARMEAYIEWKKQTQPNIERLLPGCGVELLLPEAYFVACREADKRIRPISVHAAVHYLTQLLSIEPTMLSAIVGGFAGEQSEGNIDEYRISFSLKQEREVVYGVVWPLYGDESGTEEPLDSLMARDLIAGKPPSSEDQTPIQQIFTLLREAGVADIKHHGEVFPMEFCDDCGSPLFCDQDAELVHAEMPEDVAEAPPSRLH
ncbi:MAG: hypothetical protein JWP36_700 [Paucimonas sp.]|nr:hypothetical protein [Paucimonas sp.]